MAQQCAGDRHTAHGGGRMEGGGHRTTSGPEWMSPAQWLQLYLFLVFPNMWGSAPLQAHL